MLVNASRKNFIIYLATARNGISCNVQEYIIRFKLNITQLLSVFLGNVCQALMMKAIIVNILTTN